MHHQAKAEALAERYKQQKLSNSTKFTKTLLKTFIIACCFYLSLSKFLQLTLSNEIGLLLLLMLGASCMMHYNSNFSTFLGTIFTVFLSLGTIQVGFSRFSNYMGVFSPLSCFCLWHFHLEFLYTYTQGYIAIALHSLILCSLAFYSQIIKENLPSDVIAALVLLIILQFLWFRYQVRRDYQELKIKIELEVSDSNVKNLINAIPEGIVVLDHDLKVIMSNTASLKLLGGGSCLHLKIYQKFQNNESSSYRELLKHVEEFTECVENTTSFGVCSANNYMLECTGSKMQWNNQLAIVLTFREVSKIIKLQSEVNLTSKTLRILQGVSHELKTPLNKIINDHREILKRSEVEESIREHVGKSYSYAKYLLSLIKDMIDYSHIKFNKLQLNFEWVEVDGILSRCIKMYEDMNKNYDIEYENMSFEDFRVNTDKIRFKQCLLNLINFSLG